MAIAFDRETVMRKLLDNRLIVECTTLNVPGECWLWNAGGSTDGYGKIWVAGDSRYVHRVSAAVWLGIDLDSTLFVRHDCIGSKKCFNPDHLNPGTQADNNKDIVDQGRHRNSFLTDSDVARLIWTIRKGKKTISKWAHQSGVAYSTALNAYKGVTHTEVAASIHARATAKGLPPPYFEENTNVGDRLDPADDPIYQRIMAEVVGLPF